MNWDLQTSGFPAVDRLFRRSAFDFGDWEKDFVEAMREACFFHEARSPEYRGLFQQHGFDPRDVRTLSDVVGMPWMFVQNFKENELLSVDRSEIALTLTSSGTGGAKTQTFLDSSSLNRSMVAAYNVYDALGVLKHSQPCNYLLFTYDIGQAPNLGTAWTDVLISEMVPAHERVFLIQKTDGRFEFDLELAIVTYRRFVKSGKPIRILGFPAFIYHAFLEIQKRGLQKIPLPEESWVLTGGGWKNHQGSEIPKTEFAQFAQQTTGIARDHVRDLFGMAEHGIGYVDCEEGSLHVPAYAYAIARNVFSLKPEPFGKPGLLHLFSPLQRGYPSISLLTLDEAIIHDLPCGCGRPGLRLEYVGRLGLKNYEGCAIRALEYLKT